MLPTNYKKTNWTQQLTFPIKAKRKSPAMDIAGEINNIKHQLGMRIGKNENLCFLLYCLFLHNSHGALQS